MVRHVVVDLVMMVNWKENYFVALLSEEISESERARLYMRTSSMEPFHGFQFPQMNKVHVGFKAASNPGCMSWILSKIQLLKNFVLYAILLTTTHIDVF